MRTMTRSAQVVKYSPRKREAFASGKPLHFYGDTE